MTEIIIGEYRDNSPNGLASALAEKLAEIVSQLLRDGTAPNHIREGLAQLRPRKLGPSMLPTIVDEIANRPPGVSALPQQRRGNDPDIQAVVIDGQTMHLSAQSRTALAENARYRAMDGDDRVADLTPGTVALLALNATARSANGGPQ